MGRTFGLDRQHLAALGRVAVGNKAKIGPGAAVGDHPQAAVARDPGVTLELGRVGVEHGGPAGLDQGEQAALGIAVVGQGGVIVEVVLGQVGEAGCAQAHAIEAVLVQAVA